VAPEQKSVSRCAFVGERRPKKQRHTAKRIFERLRDEHGYAGGITIVKDYPIFADWGELSEVSG
jgi:hypothetical protein